MQTISGDLVETKIFNLNEKQNIQEMRSFISKIPTSTLTAAINQRLGKTDNFPLLWDCLLKAIESKEKRFACVKVFLHALTSIDLNYKQTDEVISRLCSDLPSFDCEELIEIVEYCVDGIRTGDPKCVGWKDLLPETLTVLNGMTNVKANEIRMSGVEYRNTIVRNVCVMKWPTAVLTPIASMFRKLLMSAAEVTSVLHKFSTYMQSLSPSELPSLTYQLFSMCTLASQIIMPIMALEKYFYRFYYKKLFNEINSNSTDFDSIDPFSDQELREAEETVLHHIAYCTNFKISEIQMCIVLRNFMSMPDIILTPFILSAILSMTAINRDPNSQLSSSAVLPFLRGVIKQNEQEKKLSDYSLWCRDTLQNCQVQLDLIFTVLIEQNKEGKDVITPGLVNLAFVLLKTKNDPTLNSLALKFLTKFVHKRFVFGQGIIKKLAEWMMCDQSAYQYSECLTLISVSDTFTVSECVKTIDYVMDFFLSIPGEQAMRMMSFILPILKISTSIRDSFIEVLRKAINSSNLQTRQMAVYGFCMILKQLNNSNSQRSTLGSSGFCTQQNISGLSIMTQATLGNVNNPQRHFNLLTLEIIGLLRNCLNEGEGIKRTLYENLQRAVELNSKLVPHVLQLIDWHFRSYFMLNETDEMEFEVNFGKIVRTIDDSDNRVEVIDNLGRLIVFVSHCLNMFEKLHHDFDISIMKKFLDLSIEQIAKKQIKFEEMTGILTHRKNELAVQQLNFIEGIMCYTIITSCKNNDNVRFIGSMFQEHHVLSTGLKNLISSRKSSKKTKDSSEIDELVDGASGKKIKYSKFENIWDMPVTLKFLRLLHEDIVPFTTEILAAPLRANRDLVRYVLNVACVQVEAIRLEPEYKQLAHSKRTLRNLTDITRVVYERCIKRLSVLWKEFDMKTAILSCECFYKCLLTANEVYKKKFDVFLKEFDCHLINKCKESPVIIQEMIDQFMTDQVDENEKESSNQNSESFKIPSLLLQCLEILYDNLSYNNRLTIESYHWLLKFCKQYEVNTKELGLIHKLLFCQNQKTHSGTFFKTIAMHIEKVLGQITENAEQTEKPNFELKSITLGSVESCLNYVFGSLRKQIENVEYFISKANGMNYKLRIIPEEDQEMCLSTLRTTERSVCSHLIHIANTLMHLTNSCVPLGVHMDNLIRNLTQMYICLKNLARHFLNRCAIAKFSIQGSKFDLLLQIVGKPLSNRIYILITHIKEFIFEDHDKKKVDPQADKSQVIRKTKLLPKLVLCLENFNKQVILLSKKTNEKLANYLHFGTVRDFKIKTSSLKKAIDESLSHSSQIEGDDSNDANSEVYDDEEEETLLSRMEAEPLAHDSSDDAINENCSSTSVGTRRRKKNVRTSNSEEAVLDQENCNETESQVLKNLAKINLKAKKRTLRNSDISAGPASEPKKRRGRSSKK